MSSESVECPLCMEPMDFDDVDFFPCPCRYQICRFCWYKIINEENGLCPACRKPYNSEHPASYKPRTEEEIKNKLKSSKKVCPKKGKPAPEGKEYLSEYRVLQKNLIFVVGLPMRMADEVELLKGSDYFGKCGKVYKIVINQNQTFPGPQGTSCLSAYVTYHRNEDALKTLVDLKKLEIDGRAVKLSLGTTKYCSQFLRNRKCTKQDCMYLHEMGDQAASFTKEDMANGKHTEYENQLIQEYHDILKLIIVNVCSSSSTATTTSVTNTDCVTPTQRKTSLTTTSTSATNILTTTTKSQRPGLVQMTPIGTDPNDASKLYAVSGDISNSKVSTVSKPTADLTSSSSKDITYQHSILDNSQTNVSHTSEILTSSLNSTSPLSRVSDQQSFMNSINSVDTSNSLLESFYQLNSQNTAINQSYEHSINQQANNNGVLNYGQYQYRAEMDLNRIFGSDKSKNSNYEQKYKDTADIDFDPINISRQALAEMIAVENRQKMTPITNYIPNNKLISSDVLYAPPPQRNMLRPNPNEFLMQQNSDFFNLNSRAPGQPYIHDKPSPSETRLNQQMSNLNLVGNSNNIIPSTSTAVQSLSSGFPSPPPGFESTSNNNCLGDPSSTDIMTMIMNSNNVDMYQRYQNQHSAPDLQMGMNHNQYNNQFPINYNCQNQISSGSNYHNDFNYSNGGLMFNDINSQSLHGSHSWKNAQSAFLDSPSDISHAALRSSGYNRSHSMNENSGIRNSDWNGYSSYTSPPNDSHLSNFQEGNFNMMPMRVPNVQCTPANVSGNDPQIFSRQQTSHSVNH